MLLRSVTALSLLSLVVPSVPASAWDDWCSVRAPRDATVDAAGAEALRVVARAGSLRIVGEPGLDKVIVQGKACASDQQSLETIRLQADRSGREVRVIVDIPEQDWHIFHGGRGLDLEIRVPARLTADVTDASGDAFVSGVASLRMDDRSGGLRIRDIPGEVRVRDGSGELEIERVGSVVVEEDGSGGIQIRDVGGSVRIGKAGSGGIDVDNVRGDFTVAHVGSGGIHHSRVTGRVDVPEDRHARRARERAERDREREHERAERDRERAEQQRERAREFAQRAREQAQRERELARAEAQRIREQAQRERERYR